MKFLMLSLAFVSILISCTENDKKLDRETNTYYAKYKYIYENYDSLGTNTSIKLLDEYIQEFPNALDAYKFKAYILSKEKKYIEIENTLKKAQENTGKEMEIYNYYVSLLLQDTLNLSKAQAINKRLASRNLSNNETDYNDFWINLYQGNYDTADSLSNFLLANDTTLNKNYLRAPFVLAAVSNNNENLNALKENDSNKIFINLIDTLFYNKISLQDYYQKLSK